MVHSLNLNAFFSIKLSAFLILLFYCLMFYFSMLFFLLLLTMIFLFQFLLKHFYLHHYLVLATAQNTLYHSILYSVLYLPVLIGALLLMYQKWYNVHLLPPPQPGRDIADQSHYIFQNQLCSRSVYKM